MDLPADLRDALETTLAGAPVAELAAAVAELIARYHEPDQHGPVLADPVAVTAYAAYRMPATYAAVRAALTQAAAALDPVRPLEPVRLLDLGGGTGAASWAATDVFPGIAEVTVLDHLPAALHLGRRLGAGRPVLREARWEPWRDAEAFGTADLVTISYVLGELSSSSASALVAAAARAGGAVLVVEPGTPAGYRRVLAARELLQASGLSVVAPCPHRSPCPLRGADWCHFGVRVNRSSLHRRVKGGSLGYEDEKFSYVCAVAPPVPDQAVARVLRHPQQRKGLVRLRLCTPDARAADEIVSKRAGERYRAARDAAWGDRWPVETQP